MTTRQPSSLTTWRNTRNRFPYLPTEDETDVLRKQELVLYKLIRNPLITKLWLGQKKIPVFRATRPYLLEPADPKLFFYKNTVFFVGVFIIVVTILKKKRSLPKVFKTVALNTRLFFWTDFHSQFFSKELVLYTLNIRYSGYKEPIFMVPMKFL